MEVETRSTTPTPSTRWVTPPAAARELGISEKSIRALAKAEAISSRVRNSSAEPRQRKLLVNLDEVRTAVTLLAKTPPTSMDRERVAEAAARIRARAMAEEE